LRAVRAVSSRPPRCTPRRAAWAPAARSGGPRGTSTPRGETARRYKPRPEVYRTAVRLLGLRPAEVMLVAAHNYDLAAARACGLATAFVPRPSELGPGQTTDLGPEADWNVVASDFLDLAQKVDA